jgi:nucleoside-diphosphate-sugar epimerase
MEEKLAEAAGKRYIVTGAAGHLGSTILRQLSGFRLRRCCGLLQPGEAPKRDSAAGITYRDGRRLRARNAAAPVCPRGGTGYLRSCCTPRR